jgi:hypothetical protein
MKLNKSPLSIRILYWLTNIAFWVLITVSSVVLFANLVFLTNIISEEFGLTIHMPVPIEVLEEGSLSFQNSALTVQIEEAYGKLYIKNAPMSLTKAVAGALLIAVLFGLFITWKFKLFITNLRNGLLFEIQNINNLKHIAYGLIGLWLFTRIYMVVLYQMIVRIIDFESIVIKSNINEYDGAVVAALILWSLAHVFVKGLEMKNEQELTI